MIKKVNSEEAYKMTLGEVIFSMLEWFQYLIRKWAVFAITIAVSLLLGVLVTLLQPKRYIAKSTFVLQENSQVGSLEALSNLSILGVSSGSIGGLFSGDNLIWLYTSKRMIRETLLAERVNESGEKERFIDGFIRIDSDIQTSLQKYPPQDVVFPPLTDTVVDESSLTKVQNKVLDDAVKLIKKRYLTVTNEEKTDGIIAVSFDSPDELYALQFVEEIVERVNSFYINTKIKKVSERIDILQKKVDDFNTNMNVSMMGAATAREAIPNANPNLQSLAVASQRKLVDIEVNSAIYATMVQQLEAARMDLAKETPLIQIVDRATLPLPINKPSMVKWMLLLGIFSGLCTTVFLVFKRMYKRFLKENPSVNRED